jgi:hypothetical protein
MYRLPLNGGRLCGISFRQNDINQGKPLANSFLFRTFAAFFERKTEKEIAIFLRTH